MTDASLSQNEINALLSGVDDDKENNEPLEDEETLNLDGLHEESDTSTELEPEVTGTIGLLHDVPINVTVELGRTKKRSKEMLSMAQASILDRDKLAGEPVELVANGRPIAKGEVVVIDENFGVRVTEILNVKEK